MKVNFFKTATLFTAFSLPLASGCSSQKDKSKNNVEVVQPGIKVQKKEIKSKDILDTERLSLEKQERDLALNLEIWTSYLSDALIHLNMVTDTPKEAIDARNRSFKLIRKTEELIHATGNDFSIKKPNEDQVESFNDVIKYADKSAILFSKYLNLPLDTFASKVENGLRNSERKRSEKEIQDDKKDYIESFTEYRKSYEAISKQKIEFIKALQTFHEDVQASGQATYEPVWINLKLLKSLK